MGRGSGNAYALDPAWAQVRDIQATGDVTRVEGTGLNIGHEAGEYWGTGVRGPTCRCEVFGFALRKGEASEGM